MSSAAPVEPPTAAPPDAGSSYGQILKSSSIIGGSAAINLVIGMVAAKAGAVFLGPEGVGLLKLYQSVLGMLRTFSGLGIGSSGVREIAEAVGSQDSVKVGQMVQILRKMCWATGFFGWFLSALLAVPLSHWVFGNQEYAWAIALLGGTMLLGAISGGQTALLQGMRRIADLARINVLSAVATTGLSVGLYWKFGLSGIVPALAIGALISLMISWFYARQVSVPPSPHVRWAEAFAKSKSLVTLGIALMWSGLLVSIVGTATAALIVRQLGVEANGYYGAAWALSGMFANFVLGAMGADFCPRLTAVHQDHPLVCRLVNEQTEVGILLALPGLVGTLFFAPWAIKIFYTREFLVAAELLPWLILGVFGRILSWPMGFVLIAKGEAKWFATSETLANVFYLALIILGLSVYGLLGVALVFPVLYFFYTLAMLILTSRLIGFSWSRSIWKLLGISLLLIGAGVILPNLTNEINTLVLGASLTVMSAWFSMRGLIVRLGPSHRLLRFILSLPGSRYWLAIRSSQ